MKYSMKDICSKSKQKILKRCWANVDNLLVDVADVFNNDVKDQSDQSHYRYTLVMTS